MLLASQNIIDFSVSLGFLSTPWEIQSLEFIRQIMHLKWDEIKQYLWLCEMFASA